MTHSRSLGVVVLLVVFAGAVLLWRTSNNDPSAASADPGKPGATRTIPPNQTPVFESTADAPPPPYLFRFVEADGFVDAPRWDDRQLSDEEKLADPWINPRWAPFNRCMVAADLGIPGQTVLYQDDIDEIIAGVNVHGPFLTRNERGGLEVIDSPILAAYAECFESTLAVLPDDLDEILEPGDPTPRSLGPG